MFAWVPLALLINAAFAAHFDNPLSGLKKSSFSSFSSSSGAPAFSSGEIVLSGSGLNAGSEFGSSALTGAQGLGLYSSGFGNGASVISSAAPVYSSGALAGGISGEGLLTTGFGSGANLVSSTGSLGGASLLSGAAPTFTSAQLIGSAPETHAKLIHTSTSTTGAVGAVVSRQSSTSPGVVKNAYRTITEVEPGKEIVLRAQAKPQIHKKVELVAQVVKPKVEVTRVMAPPKVEHKVLVRQQKPQVIKIVPQLHTRTIIKEAAKPKPQMFLSQKRRQTIAKKIEIDQHRITAITPEHGYEAGLAGAGNGAAVVSSLGGAQGFQGETFVSGSGANGLSGATGGQTFVSGSGFTGLSGATGGQTFVSGSGLTGLSGVTGGETYVSGSGVSGGETFVSGSGVSGLSGLSGLSGVTGEQTFVSGSGLTGLSGVTGGETYVSGSGVSGLTGGLSGLTVSGSGVSGLTGVSDGETVVSGSGLSGLSGLTGVSGNAGNEASVVETSSSFQSRPQFTFGKAGSASRVGTKI